MSKKHKGYLIYAAAVPADGNKRWHAEGIVFSKDFPKRVEEIHYMKSELDFRTEKQTRDYAISLCKIWWETEEKFVAELRSQPLCFVIDSMTRKTIKFGQRRL